MLLPPSLPQLLYFHYENSHHHSLYYLGLGISFFAGGLFSFVVQLEVVTQWAPIISAHKGVEVSYPYVEDSDYWTVPIEEVTGKGD